VNIIMLVLSVSIAVIIFTVLADAGCRSLAEKRVEKAASHQESVNRNWAPRSHYIIEVGAVKQNHGSHRRVRF
jgi:hypothetical protein